MGERPGKEPGMKGPQNTPPQDPQPQDSPPQGTGAAAGKEQGARFLVDTLGVATRDAADPATDTPQDGQDPLAGVPAPDGPDRGPVRPPKAP